MVDVVLGIELGLFFERNSLCFELGSPAVYVLSDEGHDDAVGLWGLVSGADAEVAVSSQYPKVDYPARHINDGKVSYSDNSLRYVSDAVLPGVVTLTWKKPQRISAVRIVTGQAGRHGPQTPIMNFRLERLDGEEYVPIPGAEARNNFSCDWGAKFDPIETASVRLVVTATPGDLTRIWEMEVY